MSKILINGNTGRGQLTSRQSLPQPSPEESPRSEERVRIQYDSNCQDQHQNLRNCPGDDETLLRGAGAVVRALDQMLPGRMTVNSQLASVGLEGRLKYCYGSW